MTRLNRKPSKKINRIEHLIITIYFVLVILAAVGLNLAGF
jgi:hypothetical protein